ncbi:hypothetical protein LEP1GSC195_3395 [Leptospira wolbachii serovar Codice str. CDC]|uniref:Uncharacterized protein n=1 Tax=Leptospira wolbachii serovar Codice str. CDC TaxID=1218599 RepID=R8ZZ36_9LEPT|nr:hypothetical protein LEP1GSC195_3395 [Leptospira wolbachii serovar Codice str. CDC]
MVRGFPISKYNDPAFRSNLSNPFVANLPSNTERISAAISGAGTQ